MAQVSSRCLLLKYLTVGFYSLPFNVPPHQPQSSSNTFTLQTYLCMHAQSLQSSSTLCSPMDCSPPGSSVHGILQARILEWVAMPSSRGSSPPRDWTHISYIACIGRWGFFFLVLFHFLPLVPPGKSHYSFKNNLPDILNERLIFLGYC